MFIDLVMLIGGVFALAVISCQPGRRATPWLLFIKYRTSRGLSLGGESEESEKRLKLLHGLLRYNVMCDIFVLILFLYYILPSIRAIVPNLE